MRTKDITIGQTYAVARDWEWKQPLSQHTGYGQADRAEVVGIGATRRYTPQGSWVQSSKNDGIEVRLLDPTTGEVLLDSEGKERRKVVRPAEVRQEWDAYIASVKDAVVLAASHKQRTLDHRAATLARITEALGLDSVDDINSDPFPYAVRSVGKTYNDGSYSKEVRLSLSDLATLLELANEAGEQSK